MNADEAPRERDPQGRFTQGHKGVGGRATRARELAYLAVFKEIVTAEEWKKVVRQALADATTATPLDASARDKARRFLADYCIGRPTQTINLRTEPDDADELGDYSEDELRAIIAEAEGRDSTAGASGATAAQPAMERSGAH